MDRHGVAGPLRHLGSRPVGGSTRDAPQIVHPRSISVQQTHPRYAKRRTASHALPDCASVALVESQSPEREQRAPCAPTPQSRRRRAAAPHSACVAWPLASCGGVPAIRCGKAGLWPTIRSPVSSWNARGRYCSESHREANVPWTNCGAPAVPRVECASEKPGGAQ